MLVSLTEPTEKKHPQSERSNLSATTALSTQSAADFQTINIKNDFSVAKRIKEKKSLEIYNYLYTNKKKLKK